MSNAIEIRGLSKQYGDTHALAGVDLTVPEGSVFGFLGPNGAGKTTTLRILTGLARPTTGTARVFGQDVVGAGNAVRAEIGFLPDVPGYYEWMDAGEFLSFTGSLFGLDARTLGARVEALRDLAGLTGVDTKIGGYSRGMKQRLGVAQALINAPRVLMLDEPTSALDPMGRKDVLEMIAGLKGRTTVFFSTHILSDVERVCDTVAVLDRGRVVREAGIQEIKGEGGDRLVLTVTSGVEELARVFTGAEWLVAAESEGETLRLSVNDRTAARHAVVEAVGARGLELVSFAHEEPSLEEVFVELVGGDR